MVAMSIVLASSMFVGVTTWGYRVGRSSGLPPGRVLVLSAWLLSELHRAPDVRLHGSTLGSSDPSRARSTVGPDRSHWLRAKMMLFDPALTSTVLRELIRAVSSWLRQRARRQSVMGAVKTGAVTVIQRFNSALGANPHFHTLFLDGVYTFPVGRAPVFHPTPGPTDEDVARVAAAVFRRVSRRLAVGEPSPAHQDFVDAAPLLAAISQAAVGGASATGPRRGRRVVRVRAAPADPDAVV